MTIVSLNCVTTTRRNSFFIVQLRDLFSGDVDKMTKLLYRLL